MLCESLQCPSQVVSIVNKQLQAAQHVLDTLMGQFSWHSDPNRLLATTNEITSQENEDLVLICEQAWMVIVDNFLELQRIVNTTAENILDSTSLFPYPIACSICSFFKEVTQVVSSFRTQAIIGASTMDTDNSKERTELIKLYGETFGEKIDLGIKALLLSIQNLKKLQQKEDAFVPHTLDQNAPESNPAKEKDEVELVDELTQGHFVKFHQYLAAVQTSLNISGVHEALQDIIRTIVNFSATQDATLSQAHQIAFALAAHLCPLIEQYHRYY